MLRYGLVAVNAEVIVNLGEAHHSVVVILLQSVCCAMAAQSSMAVMQVVHGVTLVSIPHIIAVLAPALHHLAHEVGVAPSTSAAPPPVERLWMMLISRRQVAMHARPSAPGGYRGLRGRGSLTGRACTGAFGSPRVFVMSSGRLHIITVVSVLQVLGFSLLLPLKLLLQGEQEGLDIDLVLNEMIDMLIVTLAGVQQGACFCLIQSLVDQTFSHWIHMPRNHPLQYRLLLL